MSRRPKGSFEIDFRGEPQTVIIDAFDVDHSVNAMECEWHFQDVSPEEHDAMRITDAEEEEIYQRIDRYMQERDDD